MAVVTGPCFSLSASGKLGGALEYACGKRVAVAKRKNPGLENEVFNRQQLKFKAGIAVWKSLTGAQKQEWRIVGWWQGGSSDIHPQEVYIDGYQAFMSYYLRYGVGGWINYPLPPPGA